MRVAVLYGGISAERGVSLVTGRAVGAALVERGHDVLLVDTALGDHPVGVREAQAAAELAPHGSGPASDAPDHRPGSTAEAVTGEAVSAADVVFIALHGGAGENGTVQGLLELAGKRYTGSGVLASALAMDKRMSKLAFLKADVPTPDWRVVEVDSKARSRERSGSPSFSSDIPPSEAGGSIEELGGYPVIVKPNDQGSTVGLTLARDEGELAVAIDLAACYSSNVLVERYIPGRELTVAVLDDSSLPVVEMEPKAGLYDYECKYTKGMTVYTCPAEIPDETASGMSDAGLNAFRCLGCHGYARADFRLAPDGRYYCLEVNTVPGMTEVSLVPMAAKAAGLSFGELCERILDTALH